ncbi:hypothetical protein [Nannocystis punicea]|uniref:Type II toxin-antitoxin system RelE/ParE family toxin n=1 Tax=Nannocystis punicea TaxID=2995304 RepID=A0ABY7H5X1_9BACT|nr:hypothetical protein [Nannocystis poenicansa]WAS94475.1 hypothetical protein O0S08_50810 [Nannocystis poenicansa]
MSLPVRLSGFATADPSALYAFRDNLHPHGTHLRRLQLDLALDRLFRQIQDFPLAYPPWRKNIRRIVTRRFLLAIYYVVVQDHILVLGIADRRQDPRRLRFTAR